MHLNRSEPALGLVANRSPDPELSGRFGHEDSRIFLAETSQLSPSQVQLLGTRKGRRDRQRFWLIDLQLNCSDPVQLELDLLFTAVAIRTCNPTKPQTEPEPPSSGGAEAAELNRVDRVLQNRHVLHIHPLPFLLTRPPEPEPPQSASDWRTVWVSESAARVSCRPEPGQRSHTAAEGSDWVQVLVLSESSRTVPVFGTRTKWAEKCPELQETLFLFRTIRLDAADFTQCASHGSFAHRWQETLYNMFHFVTLYVVPLLLMSCCYSRILLHINQQHLQHKGTPPVIHLQHNETSGESPLRRSGTDLIPKARMKTLKMTVVIVLSFVVCWTPYYLLGIWYWFQPDMLRVTPEYVHHALFVFGNLNTCCDPVIYGFYTPSFRADLAAFCRRTRSHTKPRSPSVRPGPHSGEDKAQPGPAHQGNQAAPR
ncbi:hypothetical protein CCH79_00019841 [Gambusia affinis]|uniref:G-protein coupled receptors family 1 profile domain-containing protein n=1 Tax=Gambusia affinis TaxID=33528 RepID=A0A315W070_GAMAF|nr:hypothetical protein CCH79_00019841 [Gambusia affinis]